VIVRSLEAENLLCYRRLRLAELPQRGLIGVSGDNESGKSAIGEILCFALFGRSYALGTAEIGTLVRWGAPRGSVTLVFAADGQDYEVRRQVEAAGEQSARLSLRGSTEPLARGCDDVAGRLAALLGFGFDELLETFYLAQRELTAPHPHSPALRQMGGVAPLLACAEELRAEVAADQEAGERLAARIAEVDTGLAELAQAYPPVDEIERELAETRGREHSVAGLLKGLAEAARGYNAAAAPARGAGLRLGLIGLSSALTLLAAILVAGGWAMLRLRPELWPMPAVRRGLDAMLVPLGLTAEAALVYAGIALVGVLLLLGVWRLSLALAAGRRRACARRLAASFERIDELEAGPLPSARRSIPLERLEPREIALDERPLVDRPDSERRMRLVQRVLTLSASPQELRAAVAHEGSWLEHLAAGLAERREALTASLESARLARERTKSLSAERTQSVEQLAERRARVATSVLAADLLEENARRLWGRFAERLALGVGRILPRLTDGGYEHLQIADDLSVRLYSRDKRGYLDAAETSSGTQRQVMLALRLALIGELASRLGRGRQLAFLDEPFAFFDETRMRGALNALREDEALAQVWLVAQRFPQDAGLALEIRCRRHPDSLEVGVGTPGH